MEGKSENVVERKVIIVDNTDNRNTTAICLVCKVKFYNEAENAGSVIEYRCPECRGCNKCRKGDVIEKMSFKQEREQCLIEDCVTLNLKDKEVIASLPFICNPDEKLSPNHDVALKVYNQQLKKLSRDPEKKTGVIQSERKLQDAGHVDWVVNVSEKDLRGILEGSDGHFLPWRFVENEGSISTPVRLVFDASSITATGNSLNDTLAKGINSMNPMIQVIIRFRSYDVAIHTDIRQMYNVVKLLPEHWKFQRYLFDEFLNPDNEPEEKAVQTIIYGVTSSGNQAACGLRITASEQRDKFPEASSSIIDDSYVDDVATGSDETSGEKLSSEITTVLAGGGFVPKGYTISRQPPPPDPERSSLQK